MRVKTDAKTGHDWVMLALLLLNGLMSRQLCCQIGTFTQIAVPQCISTSDAKGTVPGASCETREPSPSSPLVSQIAVPQCISTSDAKGTVPGAPLS
jgi:hypothetical protein